MDAIFLQGSWNYDQSDVAMRTGQEGGISERNQLDLENDWVGEF